MKKPLMVVTGIVACALLVSATADAQASSLGYVVTIEQTGSNVVATGSGEIDTTGLDGSTSSGTAFPFIGPNTSYIYMGTGEYEGIGVSITGPSNFGSGSFNEASSSGGDPAGIHPSAAQTVYFPNGYISGSALSDGATWDDATLASLGLTAGTYVWTYGSLADQTFTLDIVAPTATPLPAALPVFATGLGAVGLFGWRRKRKAPAAA